MTPGELVEIKLTHCIWKEFLALLECELLLLYICWHINPILAVALPIAQALALIFNYGEHKKPDNT